jgi:hypothetical protein
MKIDECLYEDLNREYDRNLEIIAGLEVWNWELEFIFSGKNLRHLCEISGSPMIKRCVLLLSPG